MITLYRNGRTALAVVAILLSPMLVGCGTTADAPGLGMPTYDGLEQLPVPEAATPSSSGPITGSGPYDTHVRDFTVPAEFSEQDVINWYRELDLAKRSWQDWRWCRDSAIGDDEKPVPPPFVWKRGNHILWIDVGVIENDLSPDRGELVITQASVTDDYPDLTC